MYNRFIQPVRAQVRMWVAASDVDEVVSATFMTAWSRFDEMEEATQKAWLLGVARNHSRNSSRSSRRSDALIDAIEAIRPVTEERLYADGLDPVELAPLVAAMANLDEDLQEVLVLSAWHELSPAEIAIALSISPNAARVRLHRARARLAVEFERLSHEGEDRP
ncbi:MAG TPA: sigma-70 family RNA polymerase sigma factor [Ilumatobacteraceae bacterium]